MRNTPSCRVCTSRYTACVQNILGRRTGNFYPQWVCLDCRSFFHTSGYQETHQQKIDDFQYLFSHREHHTKLQNQLFLELKTRVPHITTCCEIGHGLGLFLKAVRDYGCEGFGFETNKNCHNFAKVELGLSCELGVFDIHHPSRYDLIASVMVFEHLENPRDLFTTMRDRLNPDGAIYLSVPFIHRRDWPFLWKADKEPGGAPPDVFYDNDVHITHFSVEGMKQMGLGLGAREADYFVSDDTAYLSPGAYHGVLFRF